MTRDEYLKTAEGCLAGFVGRGDVSVDVVTARSLAAIACLLMVAQMDRDAAKPQPAVDHPDSSGDSGRWAAEDPRR